MDILCRIMKFMKFIKEKPVKLKEIMTKFQINFSELKRIIDFLYEFDLIDYLNIRIYLGDEGNVIYDLDDLSEDKKEFRKQFNELTIYLYGNNNFIDKINELNDNQLWTLYKLFKFCNNDYIREVSKIFFSKYDSKYKNDFDVLNSKLIIKQYLKVFDNIDENIFMNIYHAVDKECCLNLKMKKGNSIYDISPMRMYFNDDVNAFYVEYYKKRKFSIIRLDKIASVTKSYYPYRRAKVPIHNWGFGKKPEKICFKIYDEKNSTETAFRFLSRKDIIYTKKLKDCTEYEVYVWDVNLFLHWARGLLPQIVIEKPLYLRKRMIKEILLWEKNYNIF